MLAESAIGVEIYNDKLSLNIKEEFLQVNDHEEFLSVFKNDIKDMSFKKIEINFEGIFFEITNLLEGLIVKSNKAGRRKTEVVLNLGELDLEARLRCLRSLKKLKVKSFEINYF
tara:strand:+ start:3923 stop:4264 length:342 start_codon:yes stop_codon:yes gene_type:complete